MSEATDEPELPGTCDCPAHDGFAGCKVGTVTVIRRLRGQVDDMRNACDAREYQVEQLTAQLEAFKGPALGRRMMVLEEAALECFAVAERQAGLGDHHGRLGALACVDAIRAMKGQSFPVNLGEELAQAADADARRRKP